MQSKRKVGSKKFNFNAAFGLPIGLIIIFAGLFAPHA
jgi:hypothetical protein